MNLYYESYGIGSPIILIPGFASASWLWFKQIGDFAKHFQVIIFDPRGISRSKFEPNEAQNVSIPLIAEDICTILAELKLKKASILGTSFGGFVAQEFALQFPEKLDKLILACTSFGGKNHVLPDNFEVLNAFVATENLNTRERIRRFMTPAFRKNFVENDSETVEKVCELREANEVPDNVYLQQLQAAKTFDSEKRIPTISAQTLVITGDSDQVVPMRNSLNLSKLIPNGQLEIVKNSGHLFFIEQSDKFNGIICDFLKCK